MYAEVLTYAAPEKCGTASVALPCLGPAPMAVVWAAGPAIGTVGAWVVLRETSWGWPLQDAMAVAMMVLVMRQFRLPSLKVHSAALVQFLVLLF